MNYELRACCRRGGGAFYSTPDAPRDTDRSGATLPVIATLPEPPDPEEHVAFHEAAHAIAYHALGGEIDRVTIVGQPHVKCVSDPPDLADRIIMLLAGPAASDAYHHMQRTLFADELADYTARVDDVTFGNCDHCRAVLVSTVLASKTGRDRAEVFREGERRANAFVRDRRVRLAIRALADELMEHHTLSGKRAHSIIEPFVPFGGLLNAKENQETARR